MLATNKFCMEQKYRAVLCNKFCSVLYTTNKSVYFCVMNVWTAITDRQTNHTNFTFTCPNKTS